MFVVAPCEITLTEFIDGAARLRGGAKAIDVWRMETKLEVLFEEAEGKMKEIFSFDSINIINYPQYKLN